MNICGQGEIQIPINNSFDRNHAPSVHVSHIIHDPPILNQMPPSNGIATHHLKDHMTSNRKVVRYRECLKNHAASMGGNATDGCGEFMPSGEEGTIEAFKCSACNCHRNFHRKDTEGDQYDYYQRKQPGLLVGCPTISRAQPPMIMPSSMSLLTPESDEQEGCCGNHVRPPLTKKRFRTKFTQEQKEKMIVFAEKIGWKLLKQEESVIQQFCQEIGVKRRVLKVWMHNNKHHLAKKDNNI